MPSQRVSRRPQTKGATRVTAKYHAAPAHDALPVVPIQVIDNPEAARPVDILTLQHQVGNTAVQRMLGRPPLQPKLPVVQQAGNTRPPAVQREGPETTLPLPKTESIGPMPPTKTRKAPRKIFVTNQALTKLPQKHLRKVPKKPLPHPLTKLPVRPSKPLPKPPSDGKKSIKQGGKNPLLSMNIPEDEAPRLWSKVHEAGMGGLKPKADPELKVIQEALDEYKAVYRQPAGPGEEGQYYQARYQHLTLLVTYCGDWLKVNRALLGDRDWRRTRGFVLSLKWQAQREIQEIASAKKLMLSQPEKPQAESSLTKTMKGVGKFFKGIGKGLQWAFIGAEKFKPEPISFDPETVMTAGEFQRACGITQHSWLLRRIWSNTYDRVYYYLWEYNLLRANDPQGKNHTKRVAILKDILEKAQALKESTFASAKPDERDKTLRTVVDILLGQVQRERNSLLKWDPDRALEQTQKITPDTPAPEEEAPKEGAPPAKKEKPTLLDKLKQGWETLKQVPGKLWKAAKKTAHRTFGKDFRPEEAVALNAQTLTPDELSKLVELIEAAMATEKDLAQKMPNDPAGAARRAYMYLPAQLRPKSADPREKIVLQAKLQLFKEALAPMKRTGETARTIMDYAGYGGSYGLGLPAQAGSGVSGLTKTGMSQMEKAVPGPLLVKFPVSSLKAEQTAGIFDAIGAVGSVVSLVSGALKSFTHKWDKLGLKEGLQSFLESIPQAVTFVDKAISSGFKVAASFGDMVGKTGIPIVSAIMGFVGLLENVRVIFRQFDRIDKEKVVIKGAKDNPLKGAFKSLGMRNYTLLLRVLAKALANIGRVVGGIIQAVDPTGSVGTVVSTIATVASALEGVGETLHESYRAGLRQETELKAEAGIKGSAKKVLKRSPKYALTAIILEARRGNFDASDYLAVYGVTKEMLADEKKYPLPRIRDLMYRKLEESPDPKTLTQKIWDFLAKLGLVERA